MSSDVGAIIVAAGSSQRMGVDKILLPLGDKPLIAWSVDICQACDLISQVVIVLNKGNFGSVERLAVERGWTKARLCLGGEKRRDSVMQGLNLLGGHRWVIIHDGARPFLTAELIHRGLEAAQETGAAIAAVPAKDSVKLSNADMFVRQTLPRDNIWMAQTPQVFRFDIITDAHAKIKDDVTDDAELVEKLGYTVKLYMGSYSNIKVTSPEDFALARVIVEEHRNGASWARI
jgi:2-C-methyl-D-erythritol 4-phosphate cytidylyltransferase